jgi:hypothetical protein
MTTADGPYRYKVFTVYMDGRAIGRLRSDVHTHDGAPVTTTGDACAYMRALIARHDDAPHTFSARARVVTSKRAPRWAR